MSMIRRIASASVLAATVVGAVLSLAEAPSLETGWPSAASSAPDGSSLSVTSLNPDTDYPHPKAENSAIPRDRRQPTSVQVALAI
ncbi:hypothetical protein [Amycolatopsis alba]|uniref:hypothetical protein n=1 Tax=Amycolatopsis alba TaxID=76020 RepID=UPI00117787C3|nr:hypothetical protein [Amycolatopsis alba]